MDELGTHSPWFSQETIETFKRQTQMTELLKRYNPDGAEVPWIDTGSDDFTRCPNCGHCPETPNY